MTFKEITDRLKAEGIKIKHFVRRSQRPDWLGKVEEVEYEINPRTKDEWENHREVYHLPEHNLYMEASGIKDGGSRGNRKWNYELRQVERKVEEIPARAASTKVWYSPDYSSRVSDKAAA